jgi:hypothetical protein
MFVVMVCTGTGLDVVLIFLSVHVCARENVQAELIDKPLCFAYSCAL